MRAFRGTVKSSGTVFAVLYVAARLLTLPLPASGAGEEKIDVEFLSPWLGAVIMKGPVVLIGRLPKGSSQAHFLLKGRLIEGITRKDDTFFGAFLPSKGFNEVEVRLGDTSRRLSFVYGMRAPGQSVFSYHQPLLENACDKCHQLKDQKGVSEAKLCYQCHPSRSILYPFVHGPVALGKCLVCHDPHGSSFPGLARHKVKKMCTSCHDQPSTQKHTDNRSRVCTLCHDPHYGMGKAMLRATFLKEEGEE